MSQDYNRGAASKSLSDFGLTYRNYLDSSSRAYIRRFAAVIPVNALPSSVLIHNGKVVAVHIGPFKSSQELRRAIALT